MVCIEKANGQSVTVALGDYSMRGVPTLTSSASELESGELTLDRS